MRGMVYDEDIEPGVMGATRASQTKNVLLVPTQLGKARRARPKSAPTAPRSRLLPIPPSRGVLAPRASLAPSHPRPPPPPRAVRPSVAQVKPRVFAKPPPPGFAFGMSRARDPEGAKDVTMKWVEHKLPPSALPGPDFVAMNKLAAVNDVVTAKETAAFRSENHVTLPAERAGARRKLPPSRLPSDRDPEHAYGRSSSAPSAEETRYGDSVSAKQVVNGEFADEWKAMNRWRAEKMAEKAARHARKTAGGPKLTRAALGHAAAAAARTRGREVVEPFKLSKFGAVKSRFRA